MLYLVTIGAEGLLGTPILTKRVVRFLGSFGGCSVGPFCCSTRLADLICWGCPTTRSTKRGLFLCCNNRNNSFPHPPHILLILDKGLVLTTVQDLFDSCKID